MITITSLKHPTMIAKLRLAIYYASKQQGHKMQGHGNRCYIQNAQGRNVMRLDWVGGKAGYIVYGGESRDITKVVALALHQDLVKAADTMLSFERAQPLDDGFKAWDKRHSALNIFKFGLITILLGCLSGCKAPGLTSCLMSIVC